MKLGLLSKEDVFNFVEFNISGNSDIYFKCDSESKFLYLDIFNIFAGCFERSNHLYDFFGATKYNARNIIPLKNELVQNIQTLKEIEKLDDFKNYLEGIFLGKNLLQELEEQDKGWITRWHAYHRKLVQVNQSLIALCDKCVLEERTLWVINF